jgi:proteasome lid subunit RPN8/RPN11
VTLPGEVEAAILAHARQAIPAECCGLLLGLADTIVEARPARNVAEDPMRRYLIDPADHLQALRTARERSLDVVGAYHSHPRSLATPSPTDREAGFSHFLFLIVGLGADPPEFRAWHWDDGNFTAVPLVRIV